ncbi:NUDIX hydrolase [Lutibaculum baratangense AMV1]|uniref:NUDIX hydrolase n=1 Tax=Lutibaculum baratangense AMV1 TaxID=631454 RepID=V4QTQ7_9HYPH|nr:NUDIX hydrolase [Lutibaculum baratangense AMV1]
MVRPLTRRLAQTYWRWSRGLTMGVRVAVLDGRYVFLVRHTYTSGWHLPGGGIERGETARQALERELMEEAGIRLDEEPRLHGVFLNEATFPGDHVLTFVGEAWTQVEVPYPSKEIAEAGFFPADGLPAGTTPGTRRRIMEIVDAAPPAAHW